MAVEAALAWYEELREKDDMQEKISNEINQLWLGTRNKEFSQGLSKAELRKKRAELEKKCDALSQRYWQVVFEMGSKPDFSGMTEAERAETAEKLRSDELRYARRLTEEGDPRALSIEAFVPILDFDPKQGGRYYNRYTLVDLTTFDLDEESPIGPMQFTDSPHKVIETDHFKLSGAVNFLSVKVASSDIGFPIHVYGTVIVRDSIDERCVYHFRCDPDHCQLINSEAESLILTGPKRGLALCGYMYVEIDLKIKDHLGQSREFSKGLLSISDPTNCASMVSMVETISLATRLSTVDVTYAVVNRAAEGFIAVKVLQGGFHGKITAYTTSVKDILVLYDSKEADAMTFDDCGDILQLMRPVVSVHVEDFLIIVFHTSDGKSESIQFAPMFNGRDEGQITVGATKMCVKLAWSVMKP
ncbi:hypothetical protein BDA96_09G007900 [Sorghum bicolor]|uniref:DUF6598 domain-containing protein n=2 Tax=Sorghum bicolor TaxID=4558 RepID=A0A921U2L8_SORBI|nr:uncharacterized protein LOC8068654 [Sorghum bicolor]EES18862.1 hypothetical protein SORBI_3009G007700 [Sorghum bicolor]KAG0516492.1 hypothetical protein BDA96_09G007900 [Sorghum bicolor]|eukprot:XP_002440432.1 uncharacterized protein LOC8068654 [Sorghum bicolor]